MTDFAELWLEFEAIDDELRQENAALLDIPFDQNWSQRCERIMPLIREWVRVDMKLDEVRGKRDR